MPDLSETVEETTCALRDEASLAGLTAFCRDWVKPTTEMAEIGCFAGESTAVFARFAKRVHAIDPWRESYREEIKAGCGDGSIVAYLDRVPVPPMARIEALFDARALRHGNIRKLRMPAEEALARFPDGALDLVYIDALHTFDAVAAQIATWTPKVKRGGLIAGHDYDPETWPEVAAAVDRHFGRPPFLYADTSWAVPF